jgi:tRNA dimethylallyltransferase
VVRGLQASRLAAIVGTNASGKSDVAIHLAKKFHGEIVSADSRQVYRGLPLCSGKVPLEDREGVPHHLLDIVDVGQPFSLAHYQRLAYEAIDGIIARGNVPFLVGGTGLYVQAVVDGYQLVDAPPNPNLRAELSAKSTAELAEMLQALNPETASRIELHNKRRMIRALEIHFGGFAYATTRQKKPRYNTLQLGITWPAALLAERIAERLKARLGAGMIDEVRQLVNAGVAHNTIDELGLEYRHILRYLQGKYRTEDELYENLRLAIRQFARRQLAWFRRDKRIIWLDTTADYFHEAEERVSLWLASP